MKTYDIIRLNGTNWVAVVEKAIQKGKEGYYIAAVIDNDILMQKEVEVVLERSERNLFQV